MSLPGRALHRQKRSRNLNFLVWISSGGVGVFRVKGWVPKNSVCPSKPRENKLFRVGVFGRAVPERIFRNFFWAAGFFRGFCRRISLSSFLWETVPKKSNPPGKSPAKSSKIYRKSPTHFCRGAGPNFLAGYPGMLPGYPGAGFVFKFWPLCTQVDVFCYRRGQEGRKDAS